MLKVLPDEVISDPYPYFFKDGILPEDMFQSLVDSYPSDQAFLSSKRGQLEKGRGARVNIDEYSLHLKNLIGISQSWNDFFSYINSQQFMDFIFNLFGMSLTKFNCNLLLNETRFEPIREIPSRNPVYSPETIGHSLISRVLKKIGLFDYYQHLVYENYCKFNNIDSNTLSVNFQLCWSKSGYATEIHTDNRNKLAVLLVFLNEIDAEGGEFIIHSHRKSGSEKNHGRYPNEDQTEIKRICKPQPNTGLVFLNTNNSYHSVTGMGEGEVARKFLYISVCAPFKTSLWG